MKIQVLLDQNNYVTNFAIFGGLINGIEVDLPTSEQKFSHTFFAYKLIENQLVFDSAYAEYYKLEQEKNQLRLQREKECFPVINRGELWYQRLNEQQVIELNEWYEAWLDVTETFIIPEKPAWLI